MKKPSECGTTPGFNPTPTWQKSAYIELCKQYFASDKMPSAENGEIVFTRNGKKSAHATASCNTKRQIAKGLYGEPIKFEPKAKEFAVKGYIVSNLEISFSAVVNDNMTEKDAYEVLIHEMIHIWQYLNETPTDWATMPHGRNFLIKSRPARADGWNIGIRGIGSTRAPMLSASERLKQKYHH